MEHKIGEIVELSPGRKAKVVEGRCEDCACRAKGFDVYCILPRQYQCQAIYRTDHKSIIYEEIKED